jgi:hypothetical protein
MLFLLGSFEVCCLQGVLKNKSRTKRKYYVQILYIKIIKGVICRHQYIQQAQPILAGEFSEWKAERELLTSWRSSGPRTVTSKEDESQPWRQ